MNLDMKLKFNFNKRNRYKNICSIEGCNNSACGKYCNKHYHQIKDMDIFNPIDHINGNCLDNRKSIQKLFINIELIQVK